MNKFFYKEQFVKHFPNKDDSCLLNIGYDDFSFVKPWNFFRVQNFYTLHFVVSGGGKLEIGNKNYNVKKGQMFFIPPDEKMRYFPEENDPWQYVWFSLKGETAKKYGELLDFTVENPLAECNQFPKIYVILKDMLENLESEKGGYFSALSYFYNILEICTQKSVTGIKAIKEHIDLTFSAPEFNIERLCYDVGISHAQLLRQFKKEYGITVVKYVIKKRIELACNLLKTTDLSVKSVAYSCGFSDEVHFMKTFKKEIGVSAGDYKKILKY